jgi:hypothetical protein
LYQDNLSRGHGRPVIIVPYRIGTELYEPEVVGTIKVTNQPDAGTPPNPDLPKEE